MTATRPDRPGKSEATTRAEAPWDRTISKQEITSVTVIAFFAWVASVYDYTLFGTLLPVIADDFGWSTAQATGYNTVATLGVFLIALTVGPLLDKLGRKRALIITMVGGTLASGLTGLAGGAAAIIIIRSFTGLSLSAEVVNSVYLNEMLKKVRNRGFVYSMVQSGWPVGALLSAGITAALLPVIGWRWSFVVAGVFSLPIILAAIKFLPESPTYQAIKEVKRLKAAGQTEEARDLAGRHDLLELIDSHEMTGGLKDIMAPGLRKHTISLMAAWLFNWMGIQVFAVLGTTVLVEAKGITFESALWVLILSNVAGLVGYLTHGFIGDRFGRKITIAVGWSIGGLISVLMLVLPTGTGATIAMYCLTLFFLNGPYGAMLFYMAESFPAHVRGTGANVAHVMAPLGGIAGSGLLTIVLAAGLDMTVAAILSGSLFMFLSGLAMIGTRTTNRRGDHAAEREEYVNAQG